MEFKKSEFLREQFAPRTHSVEVPELAAWFNCGEKESPAWEVKGLNFEELAKADSKADNANAIRDLISSLSKKDGKEIAGNLANAFGFGDDTPRQMVQRINYLVFGSVSPECDEELAVKLASTFPIEFKQITDKILELTGRGYVPGKQKNSG